MSRRFTKAYRALLRKQRAVHPVPSRLDYLWGVEHWDPMSATWVPLHRPWTKFSAFKFIHDTDAEFTDLYRVTVRLASAAVPVREFWRERVSCRACENEITIGKDLRLVPHGEKDRSYCIGSGTFYWNHMEVEGA